MEEEQPPVVDRAVREAYMAMWGHVPKVHWDEMEVIRQIALGSMNGRRIPDTIMRSSAPVIMAKISRFPVTQREMILGVMAPEFRKALEVNA